MSYSRTVNRGGQEIYPSGSFKNVQQRRELVEDSDGYAESHGYQRNERVSYKTDMLERDSLKQHLDDYKKPSNGPSVRTVAYHTDARFSHMQPQNVNYDDSNKNKADRRQSPEYKRGGGSRTIIEKRIVTRTMNHQPEERSEQ